MGTLRNAWPVGGVVAGHVMLAACAALYLAWWCLFFNPNLAKPQGAVRAFAIGCIVAAAALGVAGVFAIVGGIGEVSSAASSGKGAAVPMVSGWVYLLGLAIIYVVALLITNRLMGRQVTTELLLIVGWLVLEVMVLNCLASTGSIVGGLVVALAIVVVALFVLSMVCYVLFYRLEAYPGFIDGCVPLGVVGIYSLVIVAVLLLV